MGKKEKIGDKGIENGNELGALSKKHWVRYFLTGILICLAAGVFVWINPIGKQSGEEAKNFTRKQTREEFKNLIGNPFYEQVENLAEREGVCFDNLQMSSTIIVYDNENQEEIERYLCVFNNGDAYCFEWPEHTTPWGWYYSGEEEEHERGYDDSVWEKAENVIYLGRLSSWETRRLNRYVDNYDIEGEYYDAGEQASVPQSSGQGQQNLQETEGERYLWTVYYIRIYWHEQPEWLSRKHEIIESCTMVYLGDGRYEKGELEYKSYEWNALAIISLFESSKIYERWVSLCLDQNP